MKVEELSILHLANQYSNPVKIEWELHTSDLISEKSLELKSYNDLIELINVADSDFINREVQHIFIDDKMTTIVLYPKVLQS